jgi:hypothetical protein
MWPLGLLFSIWRSTLQGSSLTIVLKQNIYRVSLQWAVELAGVILHGRLESQYVTSSLSIHIERSGNEIMH